MRVALAEDVSPSAWEELLRATPLALLVAADVHAHAPPLDGAALGTAATAGRASSSDDAPWFAQRANGACPYAKPRDGDGHRRGYGRLGSKLRRVRSIRPPRVACSCRAAGDGKV